MYWCREEKPTRFFDSVDEFFAGTPKRCDPLKHGY